MKISSNFDSGNIIVKEISGTNAQLTIRHDTNSEFRQWFHFRATDVQGSNCKFSILEAGEMFVHEGWENYRVCASYDRQEWFRVDTTYENGILEFKCTPEHNSIFFAYFAPYSYERHLDLVHKAQLSPQCTASVIGQTYEGRDIDKLTIGKEEDDRKNIWIIARQHPGESMAEWFTEGVIRRLLDEDDAVSRKLLQQACFHIIPNMNIDGSIAGNLRANAAGVNLNREWAGPDAEKGPEVFHTLKAMEASGVDLMLDIHGDEEIPYNFVTTSEGVPGYTEELHNFEKKFKAIWMQISPEFQDIHSYGKDEPGKANLTVCSNQINHKFGCPAFTLEMPFKDNDLLPDSRYGWSDGRSLLFGESLLQVILAVINDL